MALLSSVAAPKVKADPVRCKALLGAADNADIIEVEDLIKRPDVDVNYGEDEYNRTALYWASYEGHKGIVQEPVL